MRFNGIELRAVHRAVSIGKEYPPGMAPRGIHTVQANAGEYLAAVTDERGEYRVDVNIAAHSKHEAYEVRRLLARWATSSGEKTAKLEPTHDPGVTYDAICESISEPEFMFGFAVVEVVFALPTATATEKRPKTATGEGGAVLAIGGSGRVVPVITQTLAAKAEGLTWSADGAPFLRIEGEIAAGAEVKADFATNALTIDGEHAEARIDYTASSWRPDLTPGKHEITSSDAGAMEARWRDVWR